MNQKQGHHAHLTNNPKGAQYKITLVHTQLWLDNDMPNLENLATHYACMPTGFLESVATRPSLSYGPLVLIQFPFLIGQVSLSMPYFRFHEQKKKDGHLTAIASLAIIFSNSHKYIAPLILCRLEPPSFQSIWTSRRPSDGATCLSISLEDCLIQGLITGLLKIS
jgi:hypothetical protein